MSDPTPKKRIPLYIWLMLAGGALVIVPSWFDHIELTPLMLLGTGLLLAGLAVRIVGQLKLMNSQVKNLRNSDWDHSEE